VYVGQAPRWFLLLASTIHPLFGLREDWDGYGAKVVQMEALRRSVQALIPLLHDGVPMPAVVATISGGVQLEWHQDGIDVEIEFHPRGEAQILIEGLGPDWYEGPIEAGRPHLTKALSVFRSHAGANE
jgi:hypothetical protein